MDCTNRARMPGLLKVASVSCGFQTLRPKLRWTKAAAGAGWAVRSGTRCQPWAARAGGGQEGQGEIRHNAFSLKRVFECGRRQRRLAHAQCAPADGAVVLAGAVVLVCALAATASLREHGGGGGVWTGNT